MELAESYAPAVHDGGRSLLWSIEPNIKVLGDRELIAQAGVNLLENAQRHTPAGTVIRPHCRRPACLHASRWRRQRSRCPTFGAGEYEFRAAWSSRTTPGYGLGLNLLSAVAKLHGGELLFAKRQQAFRPPSNSRSSGAEGNGAC